MSDSHSPIQLKSIEGSLVSEDGRNVLLNCHSYDGDQVQIGKRKGFCVNDRSCFPVAAFSS